MACLVSQDYLMDLSKSKLMNITHKSHKSEHTIGRIKTNFNSKIQKESIFSLMVKVLHHFDTIRLVNKMARIAFILCLVVHCQHQHGSSGAVIRITDLTIFFLSIIYLITQLVRRIIRTITGLVAGLLISIIATAIASISDTFSVFLSLLRILS